MRDEELAAISRLALLSGLSEDHRSTLLRGAFLQRFPAHVELIREGEPADFLHLVVDGQVEVYARHRDRETTVAVLGPGETFILAAAVLDKPYLKSARVLAPSRILMIPSESVRVTLQNDAEFARALLFELAFAYRSVVKELKNQKLRSSIERLAAWIIRYDAEAGHKKSFDLPFDKKVLASRLGMAPEVLSRTFTALNAYGVRVSGPHISIGDHVALAKLASPHELIDDPRS